MKTLKQIINILIDVLALVVAGIEIAKTKEGDPVNIDNIIDNRITKTFMAVDNKINNKKVENEKDGPEVIDEDHSINDCNCGYGENYNDCKINHSQTVQQPEELVDKSKKQNLQISKKTILIIAISSIMAIIICMVAIKHAWLYSPLFEILRK